MTALTELKISDIEGLTKQSVRKVEELGHSTLGDISLVEFHTLYDVIGFDQSKILLRALVKAGGAAKFSKPDWSEQDWANFIQKLVHD